MKFKEVPFYFIQNLKIICKTAYYKLIGKKIIIVSVVSGLGDYIWSRNIFPAIKKSEKYKDYKIICLGTERWKNFAIKSDSHKVDEFMFFINPSAAGYFETFALKLFRYDIEIRLFSPINIFINSNEIWEHNIQSPMFYEEYVKHIIDKYIGNSEQEDFKLDYSKRLKPLKPITEKYVIIVLGGYSSGCFTPEQVIFMINLIKEMYHETKILLLGVKRDLRSYNKIIEKLNIKDKRLIINGCEKYKEYELPYLVENCEFIITPNTSIYHMALLLNKMGICLSPEKCINMLVTLKFDSENIKCLITKSENISDISCEDISEVFNKN